MTLLTELEIGFGIRGYKDSAPNGADPPAKLRHDWSAGW